MDLLGDHEKKLEKNPFCAAFAICSVFESALTGTLALGDVGITIVNDGFWESRSVACSWCQQQRLTLPRREHGSVRKPLTCVVNRFI